MPDASYKNKEDKSSRRAQVIFLCEPRAARVAKGQDASCVGNTRGSLIDYESYKITATIMSTTVAESYSLMRCYGTCLLLKGLWCDISGQTAEIHLRTTL